MVQKTVVPFLHQHHEVSVKASGDSLQEASDCFACDVANATFDVALFTHLLFTFVLGSVGALCLFILVQPYFRDVIFSSLRAPPVLTA
jgi:hypothetical protein